MKKKRKPIQPWTAFEHAPYRRGIGQRLDDAFDLDDTCFVNSRYQVAARVVEADGVPGGKVLHLSCKWRDRRPMHDWRDLQRIKNEIPALMGWGDGAKCSAVEIYPTEMHLVDTSNQYHLWVLVEGYAMPFGFTSRCVVDGGVSKYGAVQRKLEEPPPDALTVEQVDQLTDRMINQKKGEMP